MGSLSVCLAKVRRFLSPEDRADVQAAYEDFLADGLTSSDAAMRAVDAIIESALGERAEIVEKITRAGGIAPDAPPMPQTLTADSGSARDTQPAVRRYEGDPLSSDDIDTIVEQWKYLREVANRPKPESLAAFVVARGGIKDDAREVRHIAGAAKERPGLVNKDGWTLDDIALSAWEAGFMGDMAERPTIADFLDRLQDDLHTGTVVRTADEPLLDDIAVANEIARELADYGVTTNRFRSENTLREYFGQERPRVAGEAARDEEAEPATKGRKGQARSDQDEVILPPDEAPETGPSDSGQSEYEVLKSRRDRLEAEAKSASDALNAFPKGPMGLTPDDVKASPEFKAARQRYQKAADQLREANSIIAKRFAKEAKADRDAERAARLEPTITTEASGQTSLVPEATTKEKIAAEAKKKGDRGKANADLDAGELFNPDAGKQTDLVDMAKAAPADAYLKGKEAARNHVLTNGRKTGTEYGMVVLADGSTKPVTPSERNSKSYLEVSAKTAPDLYNGPAKSADLHHNHPKSSSFSRADYTEAAVRPSLRRTWVHGHDGSEYWASFKTNDPAILGQAYDTAMAVTETLTEKGYDLPRYRTHIIATMLRDGGLIEYGATLTPARADERIAKIREKLGEDNIAKAIEDIRKLGGTDVYGRRPGSTRSDRDVAGTSDQPAATGSEAAGSRPSDTTRPEDGRAEKDGKTQQVNPIEAAFDVAVADQFDPPSTSKKRNSPAKAGKAAASAAKNAGKGLKEAARGLVILFDPKGKVGSGPSFDEKTYQAAKPHFQAALAHFGQAGADTATAIRELVKYLAETAGMSRDGIVAMKPYVMRFMRDVEDGETDIAGPLPQPKKTDEPIKIGTGDRLKSKSGRAMAPAPKIDMTTNGRASNSLKRMDKWLHDEATKEAEGNDYLGTILKGIDPKRMSQSDRDVLNDILFGDERGATEANRLKDGEDASGGRPSVERDSGRGAAANVVGETGVPADGKQDARGAGTEVGGTRQDGSVDRGSRVPDGDAAVVGAASDSAVSSQEPGDGRGSAGDNGGGRSGDARVGRVPAGRVAAEKVGETAVRTPSLKTALEAQKKADETVSFVLNDPDNIRAALPALKPAQQDDVIKAEARFSQPEAHGFLFTNGTGTGKTWTGLGVIKRFAKQGKTNVLVLAPSQGILDGWISTGRMIGVPISRLDDKSTAGTGIVATTYANFRDNAELVNRTWDMIVADEAHHLSQNASGNPSEALIAFRALTNHSPGARARMKLLPQWTALNELEAQAKANAALKPKYEEARSDYFSKVDELTKEYAQQPRSKALFLSATPFAYRKSTDYAEGFLFDYPETKNSYNNPGGQAEFLQRNFGYAIRYNRAEEPGPEVNVGVLEREFYERLKREGALSGRRLEVDADYDRRFVLVDDAVGAKIDQAMNWLTSTKNGRYIELFYLFREQFNYLSQRRLLEAIKAKHVIPRIKRDLELGRKVVVFHDYNEGGGLNPFMPPANPNERVRTQYGEPEGPTHGELYAEFVKANPYVKSLNFEQFKSPIAALTEAFPEALVYNGRIPNKQRAFARDEFNRDGSGRDIIIVQSAAGEAGISLHDTTGKHQRILYNLGLPTRPTTAIQQEGRIYREGQVSDAILRYMSTGTGWERSAFAQTIAERASTAENLALGDEARALRDAFIDGFNQADEIVQDETEGKGGKQQDRASASLISPYDRAKAFYFAEGKKRGRRDQREGFDYYATPEPIGLKMVEFADVQIGERILEPSAGHGAIARWFPEGANRTVIEPSSSLASRAGLSSPGAKVINSRFEDHHITNKYDGIVMNPPFGSGGKDAMEHLQKAVAHLRNGGRVVAILPRGGMADKRLEQFRDDPANKNIYSAMEIDLPPVMFERAGTKVATRILVLERHASPDTAPNTSYRDLSDAETINELFDRIENLSIQARRRPEGSSPVASVPADTQPARRPAPGTEVSPNISVTFRTGQTKHGRTGADLFVASIAVPVPRATFDNILAAAKANNGYYSSFRGNGAIPGFQFPSEKDRAAFLEKFPSGMREESEAEDFPRVNKEGFVLALPYEAQWGNPRFIKADRERAIARLREIQSIDPDNAPWADLVQAKKDIDRIVTNLFYWDPKTIEKWNSPEKQDANTPLTINGEPSSNDIWLYLSELDNPEMIARDDLRKSLFSDKNVPADLADFADEAGQAIDSLMDSKRKGLRELMKYDDEVDPSKPKAAPVAGNMGDRMPSGFYFKAARKIDEARETLFQMSGQSVINWLTKEGVSRAEINHFQLQEKFGGDAKFTREEFKQAIGERMFDFRRKMSWLNPERSRGNYELGGTRAFTGPRVPGQGIYFERPIAFPKRMAGGARFAPGEFESPHWYDVLKNAWASWRGSIREVPGYGTMLVGEEGQSDYMQGANTGRRPKMSIAELEQRKAWARNYDRVMNKAFEITKDAVGIYSGLDDSKAFLEDLAPAFRRKELDFDTWYKRLNEARESVKYKVDDKGRFPPTADFALEAKRMRNFDKLLQLRRDNEEFFAPGALKKYEFDPTDVTPESPIDDNYVRVMARDLLLMAAEKAVNSVAISTTATTGRIQNNRRAAHFYDTQMKPALERELRTLTGKWDLTLEKIALPKALGSPKSERPYTVWAAKLDDGTIEKIAKQGMPVMSVREETARPTRTVSQYDYVKGRLMLRQPIDLSNDAERILSIMRETPSALPGMIPEAVVTKLTPIKGTDKYTVTALDLYGEEHTYEDTAAKFIRTQGHYLLAHGRPLVVLSPVDFGGDLVKTTRTVRAHETVHALRLNGFLPGGNRDTGTAWGRLVGHADLLGVLHMSRFELYKRLGDPKQETASKTTSTFEVYTTNYGSLDKPMALELYHQEAVAHMMEVYVAGGWTDQEIAPVRELLDDILSGKVSKWTDVSEMPLSAGLLRSIRDQDVSIMDRVRAIYLQLRYRDQAVLPGNVPGALNARGAVPVSDIEPIDLTDLKVDGTRQKAGAVSESAGKLRRDVLQQIRALRDAKRQLDKESSTPETRRLREKIKEHLKRSRDALSALDDIIADEAELVELSIDVAAGNVANDAARNRYSETVARQKKSLFNVIDGGRSDDNSDIIRSIRDVDGPVEIGSDGVQSLQDVITGQSMRRDLDSLGFYSKALEAARVLKQEKGTPEQMLAQLKKAGVKDAEIQATGLDRLFNSGSTTALESDAITLSQNPQEEVWGPRFQTLMSQEYRKAVAGEDLSTQLDILTAKYFNAKNDPPEMRAAMGQEIMRLRNELGPEWMAKYAPDAQPVVPLLPQQQGDRTASPPRRARLKQITKAEIISHLEENRVGLREVVRTPQGYDDIRAIYGQNRDIQRQAIADARNDPALSRVAREEDEAQFLMALGRIATGGPPSRLTDIRGTRRAEYEAARRHVATIRASREAARTQSGELARAQERTTKWEHHSLDPSNPTYRETVIHLPSNNEVASQRAQHVEDEFGDIGDALGMMPEDVAEERERITGDFQSGHFSEPNIIGHMMTSMVKHEGKPVYLIDQIQSDWGQKLRDGGVRDEAKIADLELRLEAAKNRVGDLFDAASAKAKTAPKAGRFDQIAMDQITGISYPESFSDEMRTALDDVKSASAEERLLRAEYETAVASSPGHPLVNTTDQWTTTTLRRAIRQAAEAGAEYIAIPSGETVVSYNPGQINGMREFYGSDGKVLAKLAGSETVKPVEGIVPKNLRKLLTSIDKSAPAPARIDHLETPNGLKGKGFTLFPLTERVKDSVLNDGQPMFSMVPSPVPDKAITSNLAKEMTEAISIITRMTGRDVVQVEFRDQIESKGINPEQIAASRSAGFATRTAGGVYNPRRLDAKPLIALATNDPAYDLRTAAGHEAFHHVERELASEAELRLLTSDSEMRRMRALASDELQLSPSDPRLTQLQDVEVRAIAFQRYRRMREEGLANASRLHIGVRRVWDRMIRIFQGIRNVLKGKGFDSYEAIFERARTGEMKAARDRRAVDQAARERPVRTARNIIDPQMRPAGYVEREPFDVDNVRLVGRSMLSVPVDAIRTIQKSVSVGRVKAKLGLPESDDGRPVSVFKYGNTYYVNDGNHRIEAMRARGAKTIRAEVIEIEPKDGNAQVLADRGQADVPSEPVGAQEDYEGAQASLIPAAARVYTARWIRRMQPYTDNIRTYLQDKVLPVRRQEEAIEASTGVKLPEQLSVYMAEAIYHGRAGERLTDLQEKHVEPLTEHLRKTGIAFNELGDYLYARHAKERNAAIRVIDPANNAGSGMTDAEANGIIGALEQGKRGKAFKDAAKMIDAMVTDARDTLYRSGLLTKEQYDNWRTKYQHYVPLRGFEGEVEEWGIPRVGRGMDIRGPESKQALGRRSKADNPAAYVMQQAVQAIIRSEKNRVDKTLYRLIQAHPDPDVWKIYRGEARRRINPTTDLVEMYWVPPPFAARNNDKVFGVKIAGKQHYMEILHDPLARALRTGEPGILGTAPGRAFFNLARFYARLVTSFNPEFVVSNYLRDIQTALMNVGDVANKPAGTRKKIIAEALSLKSIRGVMAALQSHEGRTIFGGTRAANETMIGTKRSKEAQDYAKWFEEYRLAGGKISFIEMNDIDRIKTRIEKSITAGKTRRALRNVFDLIDNANSAVENGVRLSAYIALRKNGVSQDKAAFAARELTVNFNRKGEYGPAINAFYLFFNASVQGTTRLAQAVTRSPAVRKGAAAIVLAGVLFDLLNYMIAGDDDDGENAYEKIDEWKKEKNMIVMLPGRKDYVQIPMPYGYNVFYLFGQKTAALSRTAAGYGKEKPAKAIAGLLGAMVESFSPMGAAPSWLQMASPTLADPFVQIAENKSWFGGKIQPEKYNKFKPDSENFFSTAPAWAVDLARALNKMTGGSTVKSGSIDVSPESIEHIADFLGGGVSKFVGNIWNTGQRAMNGQEWIPEKTPFVRRLYGKSTGESRRRDFYEQWNEVDSVHYQFDTLRKAQNRDGMAEIRKENPAELQAYEMMRTTQRQLSALRKQADVINLNRDLDGPEKEKRLKIITDRENEIILKALKTYSRLKKEQQNKP